MLTAAGGLLTVTFLTGCDLFAPVSQEPVYGGPPYAGAPGYDNQPIYGQPAYGQQPYGAGAGAGASYGGAYDGDSAVPEYGAPQSGPGMAPQGNYGYETPMSRGGGTSYTVQSGDTLWGISRQHNTTVTSIKQANGLVNDTIQPGQVIIVP